MPSTDVTAIDDKAQPCREPPGGHRGPPLQSRAAGRAQGPTPALLRIRNLRDIALALLVLLAGLSLFPSASPAAEAKNVLVVTASSGDYMFGAGGTLARLVQEGYTVNVAQFGNDEKITHGLSPAQARLANVEEGKDAAKLLGVKDTVYMGHKSGEFGYISSSEMRKQLFGLIRHFRPQKLFIPDPYVHYQEDTDQFFLGRLAEEAWGYSGGSTFAPELERIGLSGYGAPEVYFYAMSRPYRPGEGGEGRAKMMTVDITSTIEQKVNVIELLRTRNRVYGESVRDRLAAAGRSTQRLTPLDDLAIRKLVRAYLEELAATIGAKHGFEYGEEFNYVGGRGPSLPDHLRERAVAK